MGTEVGGGGGGGALCVVAAVPVRPGGGLLPPGWASAFGRFRLAARRRCPRGLGLSVWEREAAALARSSRWSPGGFRRGAVRALYVRRGALSMVRTPPAAAPPPP